jgi:hypothetical protein
MIRRASGGCAPRACSRIRSSDVGGSTSSMSWGGGADERPPATVREAEAAFRAPCRAVGRPLATSSGTNCRTQTASNCPRGPGRAARHVHDRRAGERVSTSVGPRTQRFTTSRHPASRRALNGVHAMNGARELAAEERTLPLFDPRAQCWWCGRPAKRGPFRSIAPLARLCADHAARRAKEREQRRTRTRD